MSRMTMAPMGCFTQEEVHLTLSHLCIPSRAQDQALTSSVVPSSGVGQVGRQELSQPGQSFAQFSDGLIPKK